MPATPTAAGEGCFRSRQAQPAALSVAIATASFIRPLFVASSTRPRSSCFMNAIYDLELWSFASLEAQVAAIADDIAYDAHDIDDGLRAGLFAVDDLKVMPLTAEMIAAIARRYPDLDDDRRGAELVRELIAYLINAVRSEA